MHCHLIVSRKDQSNKKKISPVTNHRNTKKGAIKVCFDRKTLFENAEKGFDKLFYHDRQLPETFEYCNTMKNGSIADQLKMQEDELNSPQQSDKAINQPTDKSVSQSSDFWDSGVSSAFGILSPEPGNSNEEQPIKPPKRKKKKRQGLSR